MEQSDRSLAELAEQLTRVRRLVRLALVLAAGGWIAAGAAFVGARRIPSRVIVVKDGAATATLSPDELRFQAANGDEASVKMSPAPYLELSSGAARAFVGISTLSTPARKAPFGWALLAGSDGSEKDIVPVRP